MLLKIEPIGNPVLRATAKKLTVAQLKSKHIQQVIDLMIATLRDKPGVGLAAPQVGEPLRLIVIEDKKDYQKKLPVAVLEAQGRKPVALMVIANPVVKVLDTTQATFFEGCLSVDGYRGVVPRATRVEVSGLDRTGKSVTLVAEGWLARIIQHEVDHLEGKLYVDSMFTRSFITEKVYMTKWAEALPEKIAEIIA